MQTILPIQRQLVPFLTLLAFVVLMLPVYGQVNTPCTASTLTSFTPCMNFLTNSSGSGTSPTRDCCTSLRNLTSSGLDCLCLVVTGSVPFQIPINRSLAISLPRACNMPGVPVQCKGPSSLGPSLSPGESPAASPTGTVVPEPTPSSPAPESDTTPVLTPPSPDVGSETPTATPGSRPVLTPPSAATASYTFSPPILLFALGFVAFKYN
ncbi:Non-specific lipid-transfer protein [Melia azedarach]|uniref:Non-specific lipid-transfer protein n=1 Tax=Melia azedarach TaxID=155640 RepID=A0ACC1YFB7_MELAZ|nr:Non-specific lipid-transfer protein [Melia azedarach]